MKQKIKKKKKKKKEKKENSDAGCLKSYYQKETFI